METDRAASHVEFFAKAVQRVEVRNGRYWSNKPEMLYSRISCFHITLGTYENATFS